MSRRGDGAALDDDGASIGKHGQNAQSHRCGRSGSGEPIAPRRRCAAHRSWATSDSRGWASDPRRAIASWVPDFGVELALIAAGPDAGGDQEGSLDWTRGFFSQMAANRHRPALDLGATQEPGRLWGLGGSASLHDRRLVLTVVNPSATEARETEIAVRGVRIASARASVLSGKTIQAHNSFDHPDAVTPGSEPATPAGGRLVYSFPPASVVRLCYWRDLQEGREDDLRQGSLPEGLYRPLQFQPRRQREACHRLPRRRPAGRESPEGPRSGRRGLQRVESPR